MRLCLQVFIKKCNADIYRALSLYLLAASLRLELKLYFAWFQDKSGPPIRPCGGPSQRHGPLSSTPTTPLTPLMVRPTTGQSITSALGLTLVIVMKSPVPETTCANQIALESCLYQPSLYIHLPYSIFPTTSTATPICIWYFPGDIHLWQLGLFRFSRFVLVFNCNSLLPRGLTPTLP